MIFTNSVKVQRSSTSNEVHRNVIPYIVDLMRWQKVSGTAKTSEIEPSFPFHNNSGLKESKQNQKRINDYEEWKKQWLDSVEEHCHGGLLGSVDGRTKSHPEELIAVVFPSEEVEIILSTNMFVATRIFDQDIQQTIWDPVTIKGLEANHHCGVAMVHHNERLTQYRRAGRKIWVRW